MSLSKKVLMDTLKEKITKNITNQIDDFYTKVQDGDSRWFAGVFEIIEGCRITIAIEIDKKTFM